MTQIIIVFILFGAASSIAIVVSSLFKVLYRIYSYCCDHSTAQASTLKIADNTECKPEPKIHPIATTNETLQNQMTHTQSTEIAPIKLDPSHHKIRNAETQITNVRRSKSEVMEHIMEYDTKHEFTHHRHHSTEIPQYNIIKRRYSGISNYYRRHSFNVADPIDSGSVSPMSTIYHPNQKQVSLSPKSPDTEIQSNEMSFLSPNKSHKRRHYSAKTTIFEDIMMNTTVLDGIRIGKLHDVIHECTAHDIANFFPIIAAIICKIPYGMKHEQDRLLQSIRERAIDNPGLRQTIQFFMISNQDNELVRQIWRHTSFMIALDTSRPTDNSIDDDHFISSTHTKLKHKTSTGIITHPYDNYESQDHKQMESDSEDNDNDNEMELDLLLLNRLTANNTKQRRQSFTTDDVQMEQMHTLLRSQTKPSMDLNQNISRGHHRRFTRSYVQSFSDSIDVFRWMLETPVGCEFESDINPNSQEICDPINDNQQIHKMEVKKIFQSAARPVLIETFDKNEDKIGSFILKQGDDLRQDENMMFMFHLVNAIWEEHRLEYNHNPVRALTYLLKPMGSDFGAIELVDGCVPLRNIATLKDKFEENEHLLNNLIASTVGSYVAAYVLGVGDRHYDNILIRDDGTLFHIDFGYILGQKVSMDTAEFAITNDLYTIIIGQNEELWQQFIDVCVDAFMILRKHCDELIQFAEIAFTFLQPPAPIDEFFMDIFGMNLMDKEVEIVLRNKLEQAPFDWNTRMKNAMHSWATASWYPKINDLSFSNLSMMKRLSFVDAANELDVN